MFNQAQGVFSGGLGAPLVLAAVFIPIFAGLLVFPIQRYLGKKAVYYLSAISALASFALLLTIYYVRNRLNCSFCFEGFLNLEFLLEPDGFGLFMAILASGIWFLATVYGIDYMNREHHQARFFFFFLFSLGGTIGVFIAGDLFTLFVFFEFMTLSSFPLVIHEQNEKAQKAGMQYLYLGILGGLSILLGLMFLYAQAGTLEIAKLAGIIPELGPDSYIIIPMFLLGFAIKAGLVPLHIWLPQAHPVAPTPASAVLSGLLIKCGVYGIIRVIYGLAPLFDLAFIMFWLGLITLVFGSFMAFFETSSKKLLAYSSVSQIGYIVTGLAAGALMADMGAMGAVGGVFHIMNHALFKSSLFMAVGYVYVQTHQLNIYRLGGLWRKMPLTTALAVVGALGLAGVPLFNGYPSKTFIHHAITFAEDETGQVMYRYAEMLFNLGAAGTTAYAIKLIYNIFFAAAKGLKFKVSETKLVQPVFALLIVLMIFIGLFPTFVLESVVEPSSVGFNLDPAFTAYKIGGYNFFNLPDLLDAGKVFLLGIILMFLNLFLVQRKIDLPRKLSIEGLLYQPLIKVIAFIGALVFSIFEKAINGFGAIVASFYKKRAMPMISDIDGRVDGLISPSDRVLDGLTSFLNHEQTKTLKLLDALFQYWKAEGISKNDKGFWEWLSAEGYIKPGEANRFKELMGSDEISVKQQTELAQLLNQILAGDIKKLAEKVDLNRKSDTSSLGQRFEKIAKYLSGDIKASQKQDQKEKATERKGLFGEKFESFTRYITGNIANDPQQSDQADDEDPQNLETKSWGRWSLLNLNVDMIILGVTLVVVIVLLVLFAQL